MSAALEVRALTVAAAGRALVDDLSFAVERGERVGLIGESGSGKSLTASAIMGLLPEGLSARGSVRLEGDEVLGLPERALARRRGSGMSMVFQEPMTALDPLARVGRQVAEVLENHGADRDVARRRALALLADVGLPEPQAAFRAYPHQLSGGQRQRVLIAMALAGDPAVLLADEPTTALDVTVQRQVLALLRDAVARRGTGLLFITHDLAIVAELCERVLVLRDGRLIESGAVEEVFARPQQPYTRALLAASELGATAAAPATADDQPPAPVLRARAVTKSYTRERRFARSSPEVAALRGVDLDVLPGEKVGIVGESGSGKSTLLRLLTGLERPSSGTVEVAGRHIETGRRADLRAARQVVQIVFQDPMSSLDPRLRVGEAVAEPLLAVEPRPSRTEREARVAEMLAAVGLPGDAAERYPHEFSGGQRQRIAIARALVRRPRVLVADEPVSALDVSVRAQVLGLLADLHEQYGLTLVVVSHDLGVVRHLCERVMVMRDGAVVESGPTERVYAAPRHDYTRELITATPKLPRF